MADPTPAADLPARSSAWKWWVCGLLLLATMINYMDRLTLNLTAGRIKSELRLDNEQYGQIEFGFGVAFAVGALIMGRLADRWNVRWIYPFALLGWSAAGFLTGFAQTFLTLMLCRVLLGLFESGNWPCSLRTTQRILPPEERTLGNSILQSGAAVGAILTPLVVLATVGGPGTWSYPFFVVGAAGTIWVVFWLLSVRSEDLALPARDQGKPNADEPRWWGSEIVTNPRFYVLVVLVVAINQTWHFFRVWLPLYLQESRGYAEADVFWFTTAYYLATDLGSLAAGFATLGLARRGLSVHASRLTVLLFCSLLTLLSVLVAYLPTGPLLLGLLLVLEFGALGLLPVYYSLSQELTVRHQGKLTGTLSFATWMASAAMHPVVGRYLDQTKDWPLMIALAGVPPLVSFVVLVVVWPLGRKRTTAV